MLSCFKNTIEFFFLLRKTMQKKVYTPEHSVYKTIWTFLDKLHSKYT